MTRRASRTAKITKATRKAPLGGVKAPKDLSSAKSTRRSAQKNSVQSERKSDKASKATPADDISLQKWFAPLLGLRSRSRWVGLIGLEVQPSLPHAQQRPVLRMVAWNKDDNGTKRPPTPKGAFSTLYDAPDAARPKGDHLRYIGQWIPTLGIDPDTGFDFATAYQMAIRTELNGFDQVVAVRFSEGERDHRDEWYETSILLSHRPRARLLQSGIMEIMAGVCMPFGVPAVEQEATTAIRIKITLNALALPNANHVYAKMQVVVGELKLNENDDEGYLDWNGYRGGAEPFQGVGRFGFNAALCRKARLNGNEEKREPLSLITMGGDKPNLKWKDHPSFESHSLKAQVSRRTKKIGGEGMSDLEPTQRSYALVDEIITAGVAENLQFAIADFWEWFGSENLADRHEYRATARLNIGKASTLLDRNTYDLDRIPKDGSLGDPASFFPKLKGSSSGTKVFSFACEIASLFSVAPQVNWVPAAGSEIELTVTFPRFGTFSEVKNEGPCTWKTLEAALQVSALPRFQGRHGLDLELFVTRTKLLSPSIIRREGSMRLEFTEDSEYSPAESTTFGMKPRRGEGVKTVRKVPDFGRIRIGNRLPEDCEHKDNSTPFFQIRRFKLPVASVTPFSRDLLPADLLSSIDEDEAADFVESPIIIPLQGATEKARVAVKNFVLEVNETCEPPKVRNLRIELMRQNPTDTGQILGDGRFLVLDRTPFLVALIQLPPLAKNDGFNSGVLARRVIDLESGQPQWEVAVDTTDAERAVKVTLPPQALGEEALLVDNIKEGAYLDYRFSAPTVLELEPSYHVQRYIPVPWNLRRLFGYPGQRDPGAQVKRMRFELLYGLTADFSAKDAEKIIRVAELFARIGTIPGGLPIALPWISEKAHDQAWSALRVRWNSWARQYALRLGVLEPWSPAQPEALILDKGLEIAPRVAINPKTNTREGADLRLPKTFVGKLPKELINLHHPDPVLGGLGGGFHWGMQEWDAPFYRLFWDNRKSSSAEVRDLAFSPLGGWGHQIARFASNRLILQSRTAMKHAHVYTVERIGKIAVFGHKAKHVYRYERSVVPSIYGADWGQARHAGRPIVRKVEEYIELIEDRKDYPDQPGGLPLDTGAIKACYFPGKGYRIPIRGSWGVAKTRKDSDGQIVAGLDWEVPLWRKNAQKELYPKPEIFIEMVSGEGDQARPVAQTIANPQDIYFFTTAQKGLTDDVGKWPIIEGTDYLNTDEPTEWDDSESFPDQDVVPDEGWPDAIAIPPGYERFTFQLDPAEDEINLVSNRRDDVMLHGKMKNVTMMRCAPKAEPKRDNNVSESPAGKNATRLRQWQRRVNLGLGEVRKVLRSDPKHAAARLPAAWAAASNRFPKLEKMPIPAPRGVSAAVLCPDSKNPILQRAIETAIIETVKALRSRGEQLRDSMFDPILHQLDHADTAVKEIEAEIKDRLEEMRNSLGSVLFYVDFGPEFLLAAFDQQFEHYVSPMIERVEQVTALVVGELEKMAVRAEDFLGENSSKAVELLNALKERASAIFRRVIEIIDIAMTKVNTLGETEPWKAIKNWITQAPDPGKPLRQNLAAARSKVQELKDSLEETIDILIVNVNDAAKISAAAVAMTLRTAGASVRKEGAGLANLLEETVVVIQRMVRAEVEGVQELQDIQAEVKGFLEHAKAALDGVKAAVDSAQGDAKQIIDVARKAIEKERGMLDTRLGNLIDDVQSKLQTLLCPLANLQFPLPDIVQDGLNALEDLAGIRDAWDTLRNIDYNDPREWGKALDELD